MARILLHGVKDSLGLEAGGFQGSAGDVSTLSVSGDTKDGTTSIVDPVWGEETAEGSNKGATAVVLNSLGQSAQLGGVLDKSEVVDKELDTGSSDSNAALEGVHGLALTKIESDSSQETVSGNDGLGTDIVKKEASSAVGVLGETRSEALLANQRSRLVTQASSDLDALQSATGKGAVGLGVGRSDNLGQRDLLAIETEPIDEVSVVVERFEVHEHGSGSVGGVGDEDIGVRATVQLVGQPGIDGTESENTALIGILDSIDILEKPEKLADGGVCREGKTASRGELASTKTVLQFSDKLLCSGVGPDNGVVKGLASGLVPDNGGLALVGDANSLDLLA